MEAYIKSIKNFELKSIYPVTDYELVDGADTGSVVLYAPTAAYNTMDELVGNWIYVGGNLYFISGATPAEGKVTLKIQSPVYAFGRTIAPGTYSTWGAAVASNITSEYKNGNGDPYYAMPYITISGANTTKYTAVSTDDSGYTTVTSLLLAAMDAGVTLSFTPAGTKSENLKIVIGTVIDTPTPVIIGDGHHILKSESYSHSSVGTITVTQKSEDGSTTDFKYYLTKDRHITTTRPADADRYPGEWKHYTCEEGDSPLSVATGGFGGNKQSHKIEFYSDRTYSLRQKLRIRLHENVYDTEISGIKKGANGQILYICGTLATTLTDKINNISK